MSLQDLYHFLALDDRLLTAGMPTAAQLAEVAAAGVRVVINLAPPESERTLKNESSIVTSLGMQYIGIPVRWSQPTDADLDRFMDAMDQHAKDVVLVHCQANMRASAFVAVYRVKRLGWSTADAFKDLRRVWNPVDYPIWRDFLARHFPGGYPASDPDKPAAPRP